MKLLKILVIDDEKLIRWSFERHLDSKGFKVFLAETGEEGVRLFEKHYPDIVFVDNRLPGIQGLEVISRIKTIDEDAVIVFMTAYGSIDTAVKAMKNGANEYINKPFFFDEINLLIENIKNNINITNEIQLLRRQQREKITFDDIVGQSPVFKQIIQVSKKIARSETSMILLLGESGTGKDLFARAIHNESGRKKNPFITINCSTFPDTLLESEIFGHEKGAFTDALKLKKGLFEIAEGGTVFLDEIGEVNLATQVKLLSVLENRTIKRVGGTVDIPVDIRIVAATNQDLKKSIEQKTFREDLYYRLNVVRLDLPSLADRGGDILLLANKFIDVCKKKVGKEIKGITPDAAEMLTSYNWPGNVRELENIIERAIILTRSDFVDKAALIGISQNSDKKTTNGELQTLANLEKSQIEMTLNRLDWSLQKTADSLGIHRNTLRTKIKEYNITQ